MTSTDLVVQDELTPTLFGTANPAEVVERAAVVAKTLADLVHRQNLVVRIGASDHVRVEGWTLLGSMLGVFPVVEWTRPVTDTDGAQVGWEARVEARTRGGEIVGAAEAECLRSERTWKGRDDYALRSMAQTRAVSKALRLPLGFVMQLAGFDPTPADEMPVVDGPDPAPFDNDVPEAFQGIPPKAILDFLTKKQLDKLNVLVGKLRKADHDPTGWAYANYPRAAAVVPATENEDRLHWEPLVTRLSKAEASELIEKLEGILARVTAKKGAAS
jgi:hypothetical protein